MPSRHTVQIARRRGWRLRLGAGLIITTTGLTGALLEGGQGWPANLALVVVGTVTLALAWRTRAGVSPARVRHAQDTAAPQPQPNNH